MTKQRARQNTGTSTAGGGVGWGGVGERTIMNEEQCPIMRKDARSQVIGEAQSHLFSPLALT